MTQRNARQKCLQAVGDPQQHSTQQTVWLQNFHAGKTKKSSFCLHQRHFFKHYRGENKRPTIEAASFDLRKNIFQTHFPESLWMTARTMSSVRLTCTVCLPLQGMWLYSNSYDLLRPYRLLSCEVARACIRSGCSCSEGTGWRAGGSAAQWLRCAAPTCRLCGHLASSCGEGHRTLSHCHGLQERAKTQQLLELVRIYTVLGEERCRRTLITC